jgi:hypothetical protein
MEVLECSEILGWNYGGTQPSWRLLLEAFQCTEASNIVRYLRDGLERSRQPQLASPAWFGAFCRLMTIAHHLELMLLPHRYAIFRLPPHERPPFVWPKLADATFVSITYTHEELSGVCQESSLPANVTAQRGRRLFRVKGPLEFSLVGVLASLTGPLAAAGVSIFSISTYGTDYLLLAEQDLEVGIAALERAGHTVHRSQGE